MLFTLWFSLFGANDAPWPSLCPPVCVHVCVSQSCDEGTHRDRKNLCGRAAVNSAGEKWRWPVIINTCSMKWITPGNILSYYFLCCRGTGQRWTTQPRQDSCPRSSAVRGTFSLGTCPRFTTSTAGKQWMTHTSNIRMPASIFWYHQSWYLICFPIKITVSSKYFFNSGYWSQILEILYPNGQKPSTVWNHNIL